MNFVKPDWTNSILNVSATFAHHMGQPNDLPKIDKLQRALSLGKRTVVFLCMDGLGNFPLQLHLPANSVLRSSVVQTITSVFPSTTTNATTTLHSASYPSQHGYFGWSLFFEQINRCVDIFTGMDSYTQQPVDMSPLAQYFHYEPFYRNASMPVYTVFPAYMQHLQHNTKAFNYQTVEEAFQLLEQAVADNVRKFVVCYISQPDSTMHQFGVSSKEAQQQILQLEKLFDHLAANAKDALIVFCPDHGQTDILRYLPLHEDADLASCLQAPMYLEPRATAFRVKPCMQHTFLQVMQRYADKIALFPTQQLVQENYFGVPTPRLAMLGDFVGVEKDDNEMVLFSPNHTKFKGTHTGLSPMEMLLPLVMVEC